MTDADFRRGRADFLRSGEISQSLIVFLQQIVHRLVLFSGLPPMYSPTGQWDEEAEQEVLADWFASRLIGTGQLAALFHQASTGQSFARIAELYLRRHLISSRERSYAGNLYGRLRELLPDEITMFEVLVDSEREQDVVWTLVADEGEGPWNDSEDRLLSVAWSLGEFETVRFRDDAKKLSHVLERDELLRFVTELMAATGTGLTLAQIVRVLVRRFDLEPVATEALGEAALEVPATDDIIEEVNAADLATAALAELTRRQVDVLRGQLDGCSVRQIADRLEVSTGTVSAEQQRISSVLSRLSDPDGDSRAQLLNALRDSLLIEER
jgi:DNA-directed RNA polymerase specialized sigma24 family protein